MEKLIITEKEKFIIENIKATMRFENMNVTEEETEDLVKALRGEVSYEEYKEKTIQQIKN